ncbi:DotU family type IV/VI secretion system protein [Pseudomonas sp. CCM 7891]|uniref:DotU family type IV/VI secretion system protein n=1 Tax=Pseudomonas karstica TaxID=1055468 RepID=A0A7X2UY00_9PSED|nr:type IVB secretion system protein IcmH/DotU [Pseudomonas karstica]MTD18988.1 DotU family type IV/VI secretion system protein [Pseudomonas karstica]
MLMEREPLPDEKTVLLDRLGRAPEQGPITDFASPPRFEQLEDRMVYAARLQGAQSFNVGLNILVATAWELLSEVVRLKGSVAQESLHALNDRLSCGITLFETRALHEGAETSEVVAARYVLCSVIDEAVVTTAWGSQSDWSQISLLSRFHNETFGGEKFFLLLERMSRNPVKHVAMLELMYLCLSLGFEGKYRVMERGVLQLEGIRDALYRQIRHVRGDPPRDPATMPQQGQQHRRLIRIVSVSWVTIFVTACLLMMYSGFAWVLGEQRERVLQPYQERAPLITSMHR